jgi:hypothetical protein
VSCAFCLVMLDEAVAGHSEEKPVALKDIAELVAEAL